ncbi:hypothetical protein WA026_020429 [Henosepilachna vigintioctopunctata]|uniref:Uncharacterized protein n=1 Tax=Henosepilachna vigintioctopunctata TaxID=420089 RepID=A0AAW1UFE4_9CUCU
MSAESKCSRMGSLCLMDIALHLSQFGVQYGDRWLTNPVFYWHGGERGNQERSRLTVKGRERERCRAKGAGADTLTSTPQGWELDHQLHCTPNWDSCNGVSASYITQGTVYGKRARRTQGDITPKGIDQSAEEATNDNETAVESGVDIVQYQRIC